MSRSTLPLIIGITGQQGAGKSVVVNHLVNRYGYIKMEFADPLKDMIAALGIPRSDLDNPVAKNELLSQFNWSTPRELMQVFGMAARRHLGEAFWVRQLIPRILSLSRSELPVVVHGVRFANEAENIKAIGGVLWRVHRKKELFWQKLYRSKFAPPSEREWRTFNVNLELYNYSTPDKLIEQVDTCLRFCKRRAR